MLHPLGYAVHRVLSLGQGGLKRLAEVSGASTSVSPTPSTRMDRGEGDGMGAPRCVARTPRRLFNEPSPFVRRVNVSLTEPRGATSDLRAQSTQQDSRANRAARSTPHGDALALRLVLRAGRSPSRGILHILTPLPAGVDRIGLSVDLANNRQRSSAERVSVFLRH